MSWPYVAAVWQLRLEPVPKFLLLALADQADMRGVVAASRPTLERLTGFGRSTVKRTLHTLTSDGVGFVEPLRGAGNGLSKEYRLHIPGVRGVQSGPGSRAAPGSTEVRGGVHSEPTPSPVLIPESSAAGAARSDHKPTEKHVTLFVAELMKANAAKYNYEGGDADLLQDVQDLLTQRDFAHNAVRTQLPGWVSSALVRVRMAKRRIR